MRKAVSMGTRIQNGGKGYVDLEAGWGGFEVKVLRGGLAELRVIPPSTILSPQDLRAIAHNLNEAANAADKAFKEFEDQAKKKAHGLILSALGEGRAAAPVNKTPKHWDYVPSNKVPKAKPAKPNPTKPKPGTRASKKAAK
jgi:hypothetical protein